MQPPTPARALVSAWFLGLLAFTWWQGREEAPAPGGTDRHGFVFREVAEASGIEFVHRPPVVDERLANVATHVAGVGAAVSVVDFDGDGWLDVYAVSSAHGSRNALFRNRRDGTFEDVAGEVGLAALNEDGASMGSVWGDFDNDGDRDVLVYRWGEPRLLANDGGSAFVDVTEGAGLPEWMNCNAATWFDFDRDGLLDLYLAGYFREEFDLTDLPHTRIMQDSFEFSRNGGQNRLLRNAGGGRFEDITHAIVGESQRWTFACLAADFDGDGWVDIYLANDYGTEELFWNRAGETLELADGVGLDDASKSGMCAAIGDVTNQGRPAVFVTNISRSGFLFQGNNLRLWLPERGRFFQIAEGKAADCGWAWGSQFGDFDRDGWQDLVVVNGFISADPERDYWYDMTKIAGGLGGLLEDAANWPPIGDRSLSGYESSRLLLNRGGRSFADVASEVGVDDRYDGRAVAVGDLQNRGSLDLLIANQRGPLLLYSNEPSQDRGWIGIELVGTESNRDAFGARVTARYAAPTAKGDDARVLEQVRFVTAASGFAAQSDPRVFFGLGDATVLSIAVRWPSGTEQVLEQPAARRYHRVVEPVP